MISKKATAFFGTPPGESGGGRGKGERRGGGSPRLHAPGAKRNGGSLGIPLPCARERSDGPLPLPGAAAPSKSHTGGVALPNAINA
jgi:hypothetical protein